MENEERSRLPRKFDDAKLEALLDEDDGQTQQMMTEQKGVSQQTIYIRLKDTI